MQCGVCDSIRKFVSYFLFVLISFMLLWVQFGVANCFLFGLHLLRFMAFHEIGMVSLRDYFFLACCHFGRQRID
jgi:hypothetical protein